jgi:hypothetical protein
MPRVKYIQKNLRWWSFHRIVQSTFENLINYFRHRAIWLGA